MNMSGYHLWAWRGANSRSDDRLRHGEERLALEIPLGFPAQNLREQFNVGLGRTGGDLGQ
jgi:hypothetical protein